MMTSKMTSEMRDLMYHSAITEMQGKTFYCEDGDGVLRRWYPPRPFTVDDEKERSDG